MKLNIKNTLKKIDIAWKNGTLSHESSLCSEETVDALFHDYATKKFQTSASRLKYINTLYKLLSTCTLDASKLSPLKECLQADTLQCIENNGTCFETIIPATQHIAHHDFVVLFYEGPIGRAYLETIHALGIKPKKIIQLVSSINLQTKKEIASWLPKALRIFYAEFLQSNMIHYWSNIIFKKHPSIVSDIEHAVEKALGFGCATQRSARSLRPLHMYSDCIEKVFVSSLSDPSLAKTLSTASGAILFTGGGLMPESVLSTATQKFIHIHPGFLPDIRGADGALWSLLTCNRLSATAFYMSPGIDQGDILLPCWLPELTIRTSLSSYDTKTCYRALYAFLDPWIRCYVLRQLLLQFKRLDNIPCTNQDTQMGETFYFMHPELQQIAFMKFSEPKIL